MMYRCGICGDPWGADMREHEAPNGKYANGIITRNYQPGSEITVKVLITANHKVSCKWLEVYCFIPSRGTSCYVFAKTTM